VQKAWFVVYFSVLFLCLVLDLSLASAPLERSISLCSPTVMTHFEEFPVAMGHLEQLPADQNIVMEELPFYSVISEIVPSSYLGKLCRIFCS